MKKILALVLCFALVLSITACGKSTGGSSEPASTGNELVKIRVGTLSQQLSLPMYYISKQGWDVENGFKLDISTFAQGSGINEALGSGLLDVFTIGAAAISSCSVYDAVYLFSHENSAEGQQFMVRNDSGYAKTKGHLKDYPEVLGNPETVKNSTILLPMGTAAQMLIDYYLTLMGLTEDDVTLVNMDDTAGYQAFVSGEGDIVKTSYPTADNYDATKYSVLCSMGSMDVPYYDNILVSRDFYEADGKRDALIALGVQLLRVANEFKDSKILIDSMMEWYEKNGQVADKNSIEHQVLARPFFTYEEMKEMDNSKSFKMTAEFYASVGNISKDDLDRVMKNVDTDVLQKVLEQFAAKYR